MKYAVFIGMNLFLGTCATVLNAQQETPPLTVSGYLETYYGFDFSRPDNHTRPGFVYSHNRHNEVNLNLGFAKLAYNKERVRANLALMAGTYANANLAAEPGVLKNIYESNVGVQLSSKHQLWLDAGVFGSHIGFESAVGKDCWTLTRGMLADNSPYYESGVKVTYQTENGQWLLSGLLLNGWQRIQRVTGNSLPAFGHQLTYKPNAKVTLNSSSFVGSDTPDSTRQWRLFHNFYTIVQASERLGLTVGCDVGAQQVAKGSSDYHIWFTPIAMLRLTASDKVSLTLRGEYFSDEHGVIVATGTPNGFQTLGYSLNWDYLVAPNLLWRVEAKGYRSEDAVFLDKNRPTRNNYALTTALALSF